MHQCYRIGYIVVSLIWSVGQLGGLIGYLLNRLVVELVNRTVS